MCIGLPMQVLATRPGFATVTGRGDTREVNTALVGERSPGDWVLVFIDGAREVISAERAAEVDATLDLIAQAMGDTALLPNAPSDDPGFELPSAWSTEQLAALTGQAR